MQQLKAMGYSALVILLLCLSSTNGFLETNRKTLQKRNIDSYKTNQLNNRNFFGSIWRQSLERRLTDNTRRNLNDPERSFGDSQEIRNTRLFNAGRLSPQQEERKISPTTEASRRVAFERREIRSPDNVRGQVRNAEQERRFTENNSRFRISREDQRRFRNQVSEQSQQRHLEQIRQQDREARREVRSQSLGRIREFNENRRQRSIHNNERGTKDQELRILINRDNSEDSRRERRSLSFDVNSRQIRNDDRHQNGQRAHRSLFRKKVDDLRRVSLERREIRQSRKNSENSQRLNQNRQVQEHDRKISNNRVLPDERRSVSLGENSRQIRTQDRRSRVMDDDSNREIREEKTRASRHRLVARSLLFDRQSRQQVRERRSMSLHRNEVENSHQIRTFDQRARTMDNSNREIREEDHRIYSDRLPIQSVTPHRESHHQVREHERRVSGERRVQVEDRQSRTMESQVRGNDRRFSGNRLSFNQDSRNQIREHERRDVSEQRREMRSASLDRNRVDDSVQIRNQDRRSRAASHYRHEIREQEHQIRVLDRRLTREAERRLLDDARLNLSSKDENNNYRRYGARIFAERDLRQSRLSERRMTISFKPTEDIEYIPEMKSNMLVNAVKVVLASLLVAQMVSNSSKSKNNWLCNLTNFVAVTKQKVL